jgi:integrase
MVGCAVEIGSTKTDRVRVVDMPAELASVRSRLLVEQEKESLRARQSESPAWVFLNGGGNPLHESWARKRFARVMGKCEPKLSGQTVYDLRHTFTSMLLLKGAPITYAAVQAGHANASTTLKFYARRHPSANKGYVDALDKPDGYQTGTNQTLADSQAA